MTLTATNRFKVDVTGMMLMLTEDEPSIWANHVREFGFDLTGSRVCLGVNDDLDGGIVRMIGRMVANRHKASEADKVTIRMTPYHVNHRGQRRLGATRNFLGCRLFTHEVNDMTTYGNETIVAHKLVFVFDTFEVGDPPSK